MNEKPSAPLAAMIEMMSLGEDGPMIAYDVYPPLEVDEFGYAVVEDPRNGQINFVATIAANLQRENK